MSAIFEEALVFPQENGSDVSLMVHGDEFYARYENQDGYTVVYDIKAGKFCYAMLVKGNLISSGVSIKRRPPKKIRRHLHEAGWIRNRKFERRFDLMQPKGGPVLPPDTLLTFGPNNGLLNGRQVSSGKVKGLTILVEFKDAKAGVSAAEVSDMLNKPGYAKHGNACSVFDYFESMSGGALEYTNEVVGPITLPRHRQYYVQRPFFNDVLDAVAKSGLNFSQFDSLDEGIIDAVSFMYAGQTLYQGWLWPHNHVLDWSGNGYCTNFYQVSSLGLDASGLSIGTFCHESGHMLCRFPDLYDYGKRDGDFERSAGIGHYCLMSSGNHLDRGKSPSPVCAYLRDLAGWCKRVRLNPGGDFSAAHDDYSTVYCFETDEINEYFLVENRHNIGLDTHLPSDGLAIYHCDTLGSNEYQGGTAEEHYQCGLLQADGHLDLEHNQNTGDKTDLFKQVKGIALSHNTSPSTRAWDGSDSGLEIGNISQPGAAMDFRVGEQ
jgi:M6 family metalloprotease-like protein